MVYPLIVNPSTAHRIELIIIQSNIGVFIFFSNVNATLTSHSLKATMLFDVVGKPRYFLPSILTSMELKDL